MPASGPANPCTSSGTTGRSQAAKRAGSPLALMTMPVQAGARRSSTRSRIVCAPMRISALSPPPMRRAKPPARTRPKVGGEVTMSCPVVRERRSESNGNGSVVMHRRLAPVLGALLFDVAEVLVEHDAVLAGECDKALAARPPDQGKPGLARELDAPGREAGA